MFLGTCYSPLPKPSSDHNYKLTIPRMMIFWWFYYWAESNLYSSYLINKLLRLFWLNFCLKNLSLFQGVNQPSFYKYGKRANETVSDLPEVTQLVVKTRSLPMLLVFHQRHPSSSCFSGKKRTSQTAVFPIIHDSDLCAPPFDHSISDMVALVSL